MGRHRNYDPLYGKPFKKPHVPNQDRDDEEAAETENDETTPDDESKEDQD